MIGFGIFLGDNMCFIERKHMYAVCTTKSFAKEYAKKLSDALKLEYVAKEVKIEVRE